MKEVNEARDQKHVQIFSSQLALYFKITKSRSLFVIDASIYNLRVAYGVTEEQANPVRACYGYTYVEDNDKPYEWSLKKIEQPQPQAQPQGAESTISIRLKRPTVIHLPSEQIPDATHSRNHKVSLKPNSDDELGDGADNR